MTYLKDRKSLRNEIHFIEYPKDIKGIIQVGKNIDYEYCNNCNTILQEEDQLNLKIGRIRNYNCAFCFSRN